MDYIDYRKKIGIGFNDKEKETYFRHCIFNHLYSIAENNDTEYHDDDLLDFCCNVGIEKSEVPYYGSVLFTVFDILRETKSLMDFLSYYIFFVQSIPSENDVKVNLAGKKVYYNLLREMLNKAHIPFEIYEDKDGMFFFPRGAKELDDALVSEPLDWLSEYPKTRKEWIEALKDYSNLSDTNASDVADKFRKALERFFQEFFSSSKSLENMKSEYGTYMKEKGVPPEVSNNLETLLQSYTNFMNGYAKHHDKTDKNVLEYIMYQTGNIIRLLITLKKGA